ncbi:phosphatase 2C-like domain-containing protein, partial [Sparassis latifolia]
GDLAMSRALGDFQYKAKSLPPERQAVTCDPEVVEHQLTEEDEFLVLASDGIWDCLTSQQVIDAVRLLVSRRKALSEICEDLCDLCLAPCVSVEDPVGCDNLTIIVVALLNGRTVDEWYCWITDRVKGKYGYSTPDCLHQVH